MNLKSKALFFLLFAKEVRFCVRMKDNWWLDVNDFQKSDEIERILTYRLPKKDRKILKDYPQWHDKDISCRLIKITLANGESEILCTSLTDVEKYMHEDFAELYHYRWNEEEAYKLLKCRIIMFGIRKNMLTNGLYFQKTPGTHLSIDDTSVSNGKLYTIVTNKAAKGLKGTVIAIVKEFVPKMLFGCWKIISLKIS